MKLVKKYKSNYKNMMPAEFNEISPAKINLFLKIIGKRDDGYHNLRSGVTLINLYDEVSAQKSSEFKVKYTLS